MSKVAKFAVSTPLPVAPSATLTASPTVSSGPNIQRVYVVVDGHRRKMNVCSTCLKSGKVARS